MTTGSGDPRRALAFLPVVLLALAAELTTLGARPCQAQTTGPAMVCIFPAGGQRGTTVEATVIGEGLLGATDVYVSGSGVTAKITGEEKTATAPRPPGGGKAEQPPKPWNNAQVATNRVRLSITIAPNAAAGPRDLRLVTPTGLTSRVRFLVDELPEVVVTQPNDSSATAAPLASLPVVANGQIYSGWIGSIAIRGTPDRGYYRVAAKAGQTLVCQVQARELIPFIDQAVPGFLDACVTLRDPAGRRIGYADDFRFSPDPVLVHKVEQDGEYLLEVRDVIYRSHHDFVYRMRLGALPWLTHAFPLGGRRNTEVQLELHGVNLPGERLAVKIPADASNLHWVTVQRDGLRSNALPLAVDDLPEAIEAEPNDTPAAAQPVAVPVVINGRIQAPGDADYFVVQAEAGQTLALEVDARRLGSPLDSILTLYDSTGRKLAEYDDPAPQAVPNALGTGVENDSGASIDPRDALLIHRADARLVHTFESAGKYVVRIGDVTDQGGQEYAYRLRIAPAEKDFSLRVKTDVASVVQGDSALVAVNVFRKNGFDGPVRVEVQGLPAGFVASEATIPAGQNDGQLTLSAPADAATGLHTPRFLGKADVDGRALRREGLLLETVGQAFYIKHMLPTEGFLLHVGKNAFYTLSSDAPPGKELTIPRKGELKIVVKAARLESGQGPIGLAAAGPLPQGITVKPAQIGPAQGEATLSVTAAPQAPADTAFNLVITGTLRIGPQAVVRTLPAIPVRELESQANSAAVRQELAVAIKALQNAGQSPEGFIVAWMLSGPYVESGKSGSDLFDVALAPEKPGANAEWRPVAVAPGGKPGLVEIAKIFPGNERVAYLRTSLTSAKEQEAQLLIGSDDGVKVWLNGQVVHANNAIRPCAPDQDKAKIKLKAGVNTLLIKVTQGGGEWSLCCRVRSADGKDLDGVAIAPNEQ